MIETLVPINLPPGLYRNGTKLDATGRWYDGNLMRWIEGKPRPIGGWRRMLDDNGDPIPNLGGFVIAGVPITHRTAFSWRRTSDGESRLIFGSARNAYVLADDLGSFAAQNIAPPSLVAGATFGGGEILSEGSSLFVTECDTWSFDNFGSELVGVLTSDGRLLSWAGSSLTAMTVVSGAPINNRAVTVTPERFVVLLGAGSNVRKVQWADQETTTTWTPTADNQAGDFELQSRGRIICGARTRQQTLIWTDTDLWSMNYIGGELVYGFQQEGDNCGIVSSRAMVVVDTQAFWMGQDNFYKYDGFVQPIPCEVRDYVFGDFERISASHVWAMTISQFHEVWWFYCSRGSLDIDRYVVYNYRDNSWSFGSGLERTCGSDAGIWPVPFMVGGTPDLGGLQVPYEHELLEDRDGLTPYLESGPVTLDKDRVMRIQRIVPDVSALGDANVSIYTSMFPTEAETLNGPYSLANPTDVRLSAKHIRLRVEEADDTSWQVGTTQLGVIPQGRR